MAKSPFKLKSGNKPGFKNMGSSPAKQGKGPKVNLFPYNILGEGNMKLNPNNIVWTVDPEQKLLNQYQNVFKTIITPPKPKLVK